MTAVGHLLRVCRWPGIAAIAALLVMATDADAQIRGFADVGVTKFTATQTFKAIVGTDTGIVFGGGVEIDLPHRLFVALRASQFRKDGQRVFVFAGETFDLDVDTTVTVTPVDLSLGYRWNLRSRMVPYVAGGLSWYRYREESEFAADTENASETFTGYHLRGGAEYRVTRLIGVAGEVAWAAVPNSLGQDPNGVSAAFGEDDLGGFTFRVKVVVGR